MTVCAAFAVLTVVGLKLSLTSRGADVSAVADTVAMRRHRSIGTNAMKAVAFPENSILRRISLGDRGRGPQFGGVDGAGKVPPESDYRSECCAHLASGQSTELTVGYASGARLHATARKATLRI